MIKSNKSLLVKLENHIASHLNNDQFGVELLADLMGMSRSNLHRKLKKSNEKSISSFIREYRLKKAKQLLSEGDISVSEVAYSVGFNSPSYFNKCYSKYFGYPPSKTLINRDYGEETTILILPFKNIELDKENSSLTEEICNTLTRHLSSINNLKIINNAIAKEFNSIKKTGAKYVITGSVKRQDKTINIVIKLLEAFEEKQIWTKKLDRDVFDVLSIQNDIIKEVIKALNSEISKKEQADITKRSILYKEGAYDNYLRGMYYMNHFEESKINLALTYFKKAIKIDTSIAPAYAAIANFHHMKASVFSSTIDSKKAFKQAKKHLDIALKLDKNCYFNYTIKGFQLTFFNWNFEDADKNYKIGLNEKKPLSHIMYRDFLQFENRHKEALKIALNLYEENPFYPNAPLIMSYYYNGLFKEGLQFINERLSTFPSHHLLQDNAGFFMLNTGNYKKAIKLFKNLLKTNNKRFPRILSWLAAAYIKSGETNKAIVLLNELKTIKNKTNAGSPAFFIAIIYTALNNKKAALKWLKTAINNHEMEIPWLVSEPQLYPLHRHPDFNTLVKQVGFRPHAYPIELP